MDNLDMSKIMQVLSGLDKGQLEQGIKQASQILQTKNKDEILKELNKNR